MTKEEGRERIGKTEKALLLCLFFVPTTLCGGWGGLDIWKNGWMNKQI